MSEIDYLYMDIIVTSCFIAFSLCVLILIAYSEHQRNKRIAENKRKRQERRRKRREEREHWQIRN